VTRLAPDTPYAGVTSVESYVPEKVLSAHSSESATAKTPRSGGGDGRARAGGGGGEHGAAGDTGDRHVGVLR
jgi:hypothetical protein